MTPSASAGEREKINAAERPQLIADLFHALNQPITALQCSLELSLRRPISEEQYRDTLQSALRHAERIANQISGIRELMLAEDPGDRPQALSLAIFLRELVRDLEPVAETLGVQLVLQDSLPCYVRLEPHRLQQALFYMLEVALYTSQAGGVVKLELGEHGLETVLSMDGAQVRGEIDPAEGNAWQRDSELSQRLRLETAKRIVEAAGGSMQTEQTALHLHVQLRLPLESSGALLHTLGPPAKST